MMLFFGYAAAVTLFLFAFIGLSSLMSRMWEFANGVYHASEDRRMLLRRNVNELIWAAAYEDDHPFVHQETNRSLLYAIDEYRGL